ncbi:ADP-ribosylation factor 8 [Fusarium denticulatum]|uniref:ADP-ribosylation factor 8 n=1 Tax=Fusarium denticulatum TaxID=48507 RepID=A0A8H5TFR8_9HYPO|nr:ADP-ribosylation factor 8 [Fusarium denticulatum]
MLPDHTHQDGGIANAGTEFSLEQDSVAPQLSRSAQRSASLPLGSNIPRTYQLLNGTNQGQSSNPSDGVATGANCPTGRTSHPLPKAKRTVQVKTGNKLLRLFGVERTSVHDLQVITVDEFRDGEAETQYEKYIDYLRHAPPEKNPLSHFRKISRMLMPQRALASKKSRESQDLPVPFIQFTGLYHEGEVMFLHAQLFRTRYRPPMPVCYVIQQIKLLADEGSEVETLNANLGTLCGALVGIGTGHSRQISTIGGVVESSDEYLALTTSHRSNEAVDSSPQIKSLFMPKVRLDAKLNEDEYGDDIPPPLVVDTGHEHKTPITQLLDEKATPIASSDPPDAVPLGKVLHTGTDWSLLRLADQLVPPNCMDERLVTLREHPLEDILNDAVLLSRAAAEPEACEVLVYGGRGGLNKLNLTKRPVDLMLPSGVWIRPWKARHRPASRCQLQQGDSGAWVVSIDKRTAYGHVMAVTSDDVLIQPLVDIFQDIQKRQKLDVKIASPFGQLANLSKHYYFSNEHHLAISLARKALDPGVISQSNEGPQVTAMLQGFMKHTDKGDKFLSKYSRSHLADFLTNLIMCTGRNIDLIRSPTWTDDWKAMFGTPMNMVEHVNYLKEAGGLPTLDEIQAASSRRTVPDQGPPRARPRVRDITAHRHRESRASMAPNKIIKRAYDWASRVFNHSELQFTMVGLPGCGKSDLLRGISRHDSATASMSTVGFNTKRVQRNGIVAKIWDLSEHLEWRLNWPRIFERKRKPRDLPVVSELYDETGIHEDIDSKARCMANAIWPQTSDSQEPPPTLKPPNRPARRLLSRRISQKVDKFEITRIMRRLKIGKAAGPDGIANEVLRMLVDVLPPYLERLFNACLNLRYHPQLFKHSITVMIPKGGGKPHHLPGSWRPLVLLPCVGKILERVVTNRLQELVIHCNLLPRTQYGMTGKSTTTALQFLLSPVYAAWNTAPKKYISILSIDIKGAYDRVDREKLLTILIDFGIPECPLSLFLVLFYTAPLLRMVLEQAWGSEAPCWLKSVQFYCFAFVDDTYIMVVSLSYRTNCRALEFAHEEILKWARPMGVTFSTGKYHSMHFKPRWSRDPDCRLTVNIEGFDTKNEPVDELKILGVVVDRRLRWEAVLELPQVQSRQAQEAAVLVPAEDLWSSPRHMGQRAMILDTPDYEFLATVRSDLTQSSTSTRGIQQPFEVLENQTGLLRDITRDDMIQELGPFKDGCKEPRLDSSPFT